MPPVRGSIPYQWSLLDEPWWILTEIMVESSSACPLKGEALWLLEPAIRVLSPYVEHKMVEDNGYWISSSTNGRKGRRWDRLFYLVYLGRVD
jgi:hypothetical protein